MAKIEKLGDYLPPEKRRPIIVAVPRGARSGDIVILEKGNVVVAQRSLTKAEIAAGRATFYPGDTLAVPSEAATSAQLGRKPRPE